MTRKTPAQRPPPPEPPEPQATPPGTPNRRLTGLLALALVFITLVAYATSFSGTFVFDDERQILKNPEVTEYSIGKLLDKSTRPVVNLTLAMDYRLGGGKELTSADEIPSTTPFHVTNLVIHCLAVLTLFGLIARTLGLPRFAESIRPGQAAAIAFAFAALWAVHPLNTQSVTYIVQRAESLMGFFYLFTLYALVRTAQSAGAKSIGWATACVLACALGMGSKAVMLTAPIAALLYDHTFLARHALDALKKRWPLYVALASTWSVLSVVGIFRGVFNPHPNASPTVGFTIDSVTPVQYFLSQPEIILHYLKLAVVPIGLSIDYAWPVQTSGVIIAITTAAVGAMGLLVLWQLWKRTWMGFVGAFFFLVLATTSSFIPINDLAFEHRMYLPLISVLVLLGYAVYKGIAKITSSPANLAGLAFVVAAIGLGAMTSARNLDYRSGLELWRATTESRPENARAISNYASMLARDGRYDEALALYKRAIESNDQYADTHTKYARALARTGDHAGAVVHFVRSLELAPSQSSLYGELAREYTMLKEWPNAARTARLALEIDPENTVILGDLLLALLETRAYEQAVPIAQSLADEFPDDSRVVMSLGRAQAGAGELEKAVLTLDRAVALDPTNLQASIELANTYEERGKLLDAVETLHRAAGFRLLNPDPVLLSTVYYNLGNTTYRFRESQGDPRRDTYAECIEYYTRAITIRPDYANAHYGLGWAYRMTGDRSLALTHLREALRIQPLHRPARRDLDAIESSINQR